jgi:hypothetical protein
LISDWVINPKVDTVSVLEQYGRFLEDDYRMVIDHLAVPKNFEEYTEKSGRRFLIVSSRESPGLIAKSAYLCLKLAGPESVAVKTSMLDESLLVQNVFDNHAGNTKTKLFVAHSDELKLSSDWRDEIEMATDIIVFGDDNAMKAFREHETVDRRVWEHGFKFSFGIIRAEQLTPTAINKICFDFFSFYGEGLLAPKFYFILGRLSKKTARQFSAAMIAFYGEYIERYRDKLPFTRKSELTQQMINSKNIFRYIRMDDLNSTTLFDNLYGDVRLVVVDSEEEIEDFIDEWYDNISSVAINIDDDPSFLDLLEENMVVRICNIGTMQFPDFFEQYDTVDDFNIYAGEEEVYDDPDFGFF